MAFSLRSWVLLWLLRAAALVNTLLQSGHSYLQTIFVLLSLQSLISFPFCFGGWQCSQSLKLMKETTKRNKKENEKDRHYLIFPSCLGSSQLKM